MQANIENLVVSAGVVGLAACFERRQFSPVQALEAYVARIQDRNPALNAFLERDDAGAALAARASSERWATGTQLSPLDGVPIAVKANIAVAGLSWHGGIAAYRARVAAADARCVADLRRAGAVILGILNMHEAALGVTNDNPAFGRCHNPTRHGFTPGGSSGGSAAAVAAGLCAAALGTDTMGSVRIPAAFCGTFAHKPTHGLVAMAGIMPLSPTLDDAGVLARSAADLEAVLRIIAPAAPFAGPSQIRCGILDLSNRPNLDPALAGAFATAANAAAASGWQIEPLRLNGWDEAAMRRLTLLIVETEALAEHRQMQSRNPNGFSPELTGMLHWAARQPQAKIAQAYHDLQAAAAELRHAFSRFNAILTPTTPSPAFDFATPPPAGLPDFTLLANIAGLPATAFPIGLSPDGLPLSAQIIAAADRMAIHLAGVLASTDGSGV
jgi:aspartyl-tRNA(Asn)/glutamyl-tRNA(Gln) amidotransferase subunit A